MRTTTIGIQKRIGTNPAIGDGLNKGSTVLPIVPKSTLVVWELPVETFHIPMTFLTTLNKEALERDRV